MTQVTTASLARPVRIVTASSLFDGHDASINIMRRIMQSQGAEVIHLGHNRSVIEVADAVVEEDAHAVAVSSYQGGHVEYFEYLAQTLAERGSGHVKIFGGGGGVIVAEEIERLAAVGVRIFSPEDGQQLGLVGMIQRVLEACDDDLTAIGFDPTAIAAGDRGALARGITCLEAGQRVVVAPPEQRVPVLGLTGTGGSGKSSLTDELVRRLRLDQRDRLQIAILAVDPTRRRGGGALLGDRIRMNAIGGPQIFFRSLATRGAHELPDSLGAVIAACQGAGFDLVIVETPGIGQGDAAIVPFVDHSIYVMTPEFGASSQLEKIDMLDFADTVVINKFERHGARDALRDVGRQLIRNREEFGAEVGDMPVFGTSAATFNDDGVTALYFHLREALSALGLPVADGELEPVTTRYSTRFAAIVPAERSRYLAEIAQTVRTHHAVTKQLADAARRVQHLAAAHQEVLAARAPEGAEDTTSTVAAATFSGQQTELATPSAPTTPLDAEVSADILARLLAEAQLALPADVAQALADWPGTVAAYAGGELTVQVRDTKITTALTRESLSGIAIPRVALPRSTDHGELVRYWRGENLPGHFPYTAGVFPFKRDSEDPARMFAGEGDPFRTNRRFRLLSEGQPATRLSTAFDSVTLYGRDPAEQPDVYGKVGTSGVSVATVDDMAALYDGFDLCSPSTSVSMTINGPAPTMLAFFLNTAIDQQVAAFVKRTGREPTADERAQVAAHAVATVRGTVQADILKEDQGQNTCLFSTEFSLRVMADIAEWFIEHRVRNFYSVSISGYHIAEAGANPISQLAFTLANGFTYVEAYLARGMRIDDFAANLSFFFSNGMDPEYSVLGRVARRIWAITLRDKYGANERSQKLKYHIQTSGRSLHAQEMDFNDIRTTLQALIAIYDNANSLHTNAYDEAVTTPSPESVRRALAIQLIINREWGVVMNENPLQGSYLVTELTDLVEAAVLTEFDRISERGGVLGAMETGYQRGRIQDESMFYERGKHDGSLPIVGVNTFVREEHAVAGAVELARATETEKQSQLQRVRDFTDAHREESAVALESLRQVALGKGNIFAELMSAARVCTLGQITETFFEVGGQYRRQV